MSEAAFPASTGLALDRAPTRRDRLRIWLRQAGSVLVATRRTRLGPSSAVRRGLLWLVVQAFGAAVLLLVLGAAEATVPAEALLAVPWPAVLALGLLHVAQVAGSEADLAREVEQGTLETLGASPLPSSAFLFGKLAAYQLEQLFGALCLLPCMALAYLVGGIGLGSIVAMVAIVQVAALAIGAWQVSGCHRALAGRRKRKRSLTGRRTGLLYAVGLGFWGLVAWPIAQFQALQGNDLSTLLAFLAVAPSVGLQATFVPGLTVQVFDWAVPAWVVGMGLAVAWLPLAFGDALSRWKRAPTTRGTLLRGGVLLGLVVETVVVSATLPSEPGLRAWWIVVAALLVVLLVPAWSVASTLADVAGRGPARWWSVGTMARRSAPAHAVLCLVLVVLAAALHAPASLPAWSLSLAVLLAALPALAASLALAAVPRPSLGAAVGVGVLGLLAVPGALLVPGIVAETLGRGADPLGTASTAAGWLVATGSPAFVIPAVAGEVVPGSTFRMDLAGGVPPHWLQGVAVQLGLAVILGLVARRRARARRIAAAVPAAGRQGAGTPSETGAP